MISNKTLFWLLLSIICISLLGILLWYVFYNQNQSSTKPSALITIERRETDIDYEVNPVYAEIIIDQITNPLHNYTLRITNDPAVATFHQYKEGERIAGLSTQSTNDRGLITIYVKPELSNEEKTYEINRMLIKGLYFIESEIDHNETEEINYQEISKNANSVFMRLIDKDKLPIKEK